MNYKIISDFQGFRLEIEDTEVVTDTMAILDKFYEFVKSFKEKFGVNLDEPSISTEECIESSNNTSILFTDPSEILQKLKGLASKLFKFTKEGDIIRKVSLDDLTNVEQIDLISLEKRLLFEENLIDNDLVSLDELDQELALNKNQISARVSDLNKSNILKRTGRGEYKLNIYAIDEFLESILKKLDE